MVGSEPALVYRWRVISRFDHRALFMGCVLGRVDRLTDGDGCWERIESLTLLPDGSFDWLTETRISEPGARPQHGCEYTTGNWLLVGQGDGPHFLQLVANNGDMYSFAASPDGAEGHLLNNKRWSRNRMAAQTIQRA